MNFQIFDLIIHPQAVSNAPSSLEHSAGHCIFIQPTFLVGLHGDILPTGSAHNSHTLVLIISSRLFSLNPQVGVPDTAHREMFLDDSQLHEFSLIDQERFNY